jgi:hypothetical protein
LIADFENQMGQEYSFDQDEVWAAAEKAAESHIKRAQALIAARCRELGIPEEFAPNVSLRWHARGYGNSLEKRRVELRKMAATQIAAIEARAVTQIEVSSLDAQTRLAVAGLSSEVARRFLEALPTIDVLMPRLTFAEVAGEADPPLAEQLISPNALRQRRHREKQRALRDGSKGVTDPSRNADGNGE